MQSLSISSLSPLSSAAQASTESASSALAKPSAGAKCYRYVYLLACSSMKKNFGYTALCWTMALRVLLLLSRRNCASMCGEKGSDRKSTRLNSSHLGISYAVFCLKKKKYKLYEVVDAEHNAMTQDCMEDGMKQRKIRDT